ncbi:MAG: lipoyl synthase [Brevinematales bacterium]|nr:lipoyl synthase [Brevinematales bacterium]
MSAYTPKPEWLKKRIDFTEHSELRSLLSAGGLHTICEEALCPNISECCSKKQASFLILGRICTRGCEFCNVAKGKPLRVDTGEPSRVAEAIRKLGLSHAVITSPTRDDLADGGAGVFAETVRAVREVNPNAKVELLVPDFRGDTSAINTVCQSAPDVFGHNIETAPRLYHVRKGAEYRRSMDILAYAHKKYPHIPVKSGLMLGMGETRDEVLGVMKDLVDAGCGFLSLGQYLAPGRDFYPVKEFIRPEIFVEYKDAGLQMGFLHIESGSYVRSSYHASEYLHS